MIVHTCHISLCDMYNVMYNVRFQFICLELNLKVLHFMLE